MLRYNIESIDENIISKLLEMQSNSRYKRLERYYRGEHDILTRESLDPYKPNNKLVNNFASYISDLSTGYFMGQPITFGSKNENLLRLIQDIFNYNDQSSIDSELALISSIKSKSFELMYLDSLANIRSAAINPENMIMVYSTNIEPEPLLAVYYYWESFLGSDKRILHVQAYSSNEIISFIGEYSEDGQKTDLREVNRVNHYWGQVPVIEYCNPAGLGDFEKVLTQIDAYNKVSSDSINNFEYFADAYLLLEGMAGTDPEDARNMRENRIIPLGNGANASFLVKPSIEQDIELVKDRLIDDIHNFSSTPNLRDDSFSGSASGISLKYKLNSMEQYAALKERAFKKGIQRRLEMICQMLKVKGLGTFDYRDINILFTRNLPQNLKELAEVVNLLKEQVPQDLLLPILPFIDGSQELKNEIMIKSTSEAEKDA